MKVTNIFGLLCEYHSPYVNVAARCTFSNEKQNCNVAQNTQQAF